jgi:chromosomal replication initiation ATPase DnaA
MNGDRAPLQLTLDLPHRAATGSGDFLVSGSNAAAVQLIDSWPHWPQPCALIAGPPACGKSHLAAVWRVRAQAVLFAATALDDATVAMFQHEDVQALIVEDIDRGIANERVLFHLLNLTRETGRTMLLTSRAAPGDLDITLPDLRSRLRALAIITIENPDDALLGAVLVKLFSDRQLAVEPVVISYLVRHMDRSFESARAAVGAIDALALARQRKVTRAIAAEALSALSAGHSGVGD